MNQELLITKEKEKLALLHTELENKQDELNNKEREYYDNKRLIDKQSKVAIKQLKEAQELNEKNMSLKHQLDNKSYELSIKEKLFDEKMIDDEQMNLKLNKQKETLSDNVIINHQATTTNNNNEIEEQQNTNDTTTEIVKPQPTNQEKLLYTLNNKPLKPLNILNSTNTNNIVEDDEDLQLEIALDPTLQPQLYLSSS